MVAFPERCEDEYVEEDEYTEQTDGPTKYPQLQGEKTSRANTIEDLKSRLASIRGNKILTYKEKLKKKSLKTRVSKKTKQQERSANQKMLRVEKLSMKQLVKDETPETETKPTKPVFNSEGKMVFSKFDFSGLGKHKDKKPEKDPKKILLNLQKQKEKLERLEADGEREKAVEIKEKSAWRNAIAKAQGEKVRDDPELLKKSVKKHEQKQRQSAKKWEQRIEGVKKLKEDKQKKRTENIDKRKKDKKMNKMKKAAKRGKVIPGF